MQLRRFPVTIQADSTVPDVGLHQPVHRLTPTATTALPRPGLASGPRLWPGRGSATAAQVYKSRLNDYGFRTLCVCTIRVSQVGGATGSRIRVYYVVPSVSNKRGRVARRARGWYNRRRLGDLAAAQAVHSPALSFDCAAYLIQCSLLMSLNVIQLYRGVGYCMRHNHPACRTVVREVWVEQIP
jgi:hypothetical protein